MQWLALDLIGTFNFISANFAIDGHPLWIYAEDGSFIEPLLVDVVTIFNGQRFSVLIYLRDLGDYTIRVASTSAYQLMAGQATLSFHETNSVAPKLNQVISPYIDDGGVNTTADVVFFEQGDMKAFPASPISQTIDRTF